MSTITRPCPNCQGGAYRVDDSIWGLVRLKGGRYPELARSFALIVVSCEDCGFVQLFNRNITGEFDKGD